MPERQTRVPRNHGGKEYFLYVLFMVLRALYINLYQHTERKHHIPVQVLTCPWTLGRGEE
jgi:hypothetical protein